MFKDKQDIIRSICVLTIALAGLVHLFIAPVHYGHAPAHGIFFAVAGIVQCAWAVAFWRRPSLALYRLGLAVSGGLVVLWLLTLALPAPFGGHDAGNIDASAVVCKVSELAGLFALVALVLQGGMMSGNLSAARVMSEAVLVSVLVGALFFGAGKAAEPIFPQWQHTHAQAAPGAVPGKPAADPGQGQQEHDMEHSQDMEHGASDQ